MCNYLQSPEKIEQLEERYLAKFKEMENRLRLGAELNGFGHPLVAVITNANRDELKPFSWGLMPAWSKDQSFRKNTLNARIETIREKPSFRSYLGNRCLIPAQGFYEWKWLDEKGKQKQKHFINVAGDGLFSMAGIWSEWTDKTTGEVLPTFTIVTTEANELMAEIHNTKKRMPVILRQEDESKWLEGAPIESFALPYQAELKAVAI